MVLIALACVLPCLSIGLSWAGVPASVEPELTPSGSLELLGADLDSTSPAEALESWNDFVEADLLRHRSEFPAAIEKYKASIARTPGVPEIHLELAWTFFESGLIDSARVQAEISAELLPEEAEPRSLLGRCELAKGRPREAIHWLREARERDPEDLWVVVNLVSALQNTGQTAAALELLEPAIPENIASANLYYRRAILRRIVGRPLDAIDDFATALSKDPGFPGAAAEFVQTVSRLEDPLEAIPQIEDLLAQDADLVVARRAAIGILATSSRWEEAIPHLQILATLQPDDIRTQVQLGLLLMRAEKGGEARPHFLAASQLNPDDPEPYRWLWRIATQEDKWGEAAAWADSILAHRSGDLEGQWFLGLAHFQDGKTELALEVLESLLEEAPQHREACLLASAILMDQGRFSAAERHLRRYLEPVPGDAAILYRLGVVLEQAGKFDESLFEFDKLLRIDPNNHAALNYSGYMCIERGVRLEDSVRRIRKALEFEPENAAYLDSYGWGFYQLGRADEAITPLEKAVEVGGDNPLILIHLGDAYSKAGRSKDARATYERALRVTPDDREIQGRIEDLDRSN